MVRIKPFRGIRPPAEHAAEVASRPYDVLNSAEAQQEATEKSLLHIIKPEIDFSPIADEHSDEVYARAVENFRAWREKGWLVQDDTEKYYVYAQTMDGRTQYGLVAACHFDDYLQGKIKKHELTRHEKEEDRMKHIRITDANIEPVFLAYPDNAALASLIDQYARREPEYDFVAPLDGFRHRFWLVDNEADIDAITKEFAAIPALYIADGHHRTAAAALVGQEKALAHGRTHPEAEYNYFMAVCFPASELTILDYNRVVKDLGCHTSDEFLQALEKDFEVACTGCSVYKPMRPHEFSLYLDEKWYRLRVLPGRFDEDDPIDVLDVTISSRFILDKILGIKDLRRDKRIDFVGGLRGLDELKRRCDSGEMKMALALYPVSMQQIMDIADCGKIMPPKATWFEPKLRSGLVIHKLS